MKHSAAWILFALASWPVVVSAQPANLTNQQMLGRRILTQNCNICHLPQNPGSKTYGPLLNKDAANGDDNLMREVINNGLVKMPGWKYTLSNTEVDGLIAYIKTLPAPAAP